MKKFKLKEIIKDLFNNISQDFIDVIADFYI